MARRYIRDKKGRFASKGGTMSKKGSAKKGKAASQSAPPKEPHVLEIEGKRRVFPSADTATMAYMNHIATGGKGQATLWNNGGVQAKTTPKVMKKKKSAQRTVDEMRKRSYGR